MSNDTVPSKLTLAVDNKTDAQIAADLRFEMNTAMQPVIEILNRAHAQGFDIGLSFQRDQFGRWFVPPLGIGKRL